MQQDDSDRARAELRALIIEEIGLTAMSCSEAVARVKEEVRLTNRARVVRADGAVALGRAIAVLCQNNLGIPTLPALCAVLDLLAQSVPPGAVDSVEPPARASARARALAGLLDRAAA